MKTASFWKKPLYSALVFFGTLVVLSVGYGAYNALGSVSAGQSLTKDLWNQMVSNIADHESRIASLSGTVSTLQAAGGSFWNAVTGGIGYAGGKIGIGTATPNKDLHIYNTASNAEVDIQSVVGSNKHWGVYQNASDESLRFWNNTAGGDSVTLTKDGRVGIGTTNPGAKLEITGDDKNVAYLRIGKSGPAPSTFGDWVGIDFLHTNEVSPTTQFTGNPAARIGAVLERVGNGYGLAFTTRYAGAAGAISERMRITADGNVGIGTTTPGAKLDVNGGIHPGSATAGTSCSGNSEGTFAYDTTSHSLVFCSNTGLWTAVGGTASVPTGAVMAFNLANCPSGWSPADGAEGRLDLRGEFIRGIDNGRNIDVGRLLGSSQADAFKTHAHRVYGGGGLNGNSVGAGFAGASWLNAISYNDSTSVGDTETRPRNVALLYCVKN